MPRAQRGARRKLEASTGLQRLLLCALCELESIVLDLEAEAEAMARAAEHCRKGEGPYLLDIQTYRYKGHSMSDPQKYRTKSEVEEYQERDPIAHCAKVITDNQWMTEADLKAVDKEVKAQVEEAIQFAEESPLPEAHELYEDVYVTPNYPFVND